MRDVHHRYTSGHNTRGEREREEEDDVDEERKHPKALSRINKKEMERTRDKDGCRGQNSS